MNKNDVKSAIDWQNSGRDFNEGIAILQKSGFRPGVVRKLASVGPTGPAAMSRLEHNIKMLIRAAQDASLEEDTDAELHVFDGKESKKETELDDKDKENIFGHQEDENNLGKLARMYASAYKSRELAFKGLKEVEDSNTDEAIELRKNFNKVIDDNSDLLDKLYPLYSRFKETGTVPTDEEIESVTKSEEEDEDKEETEEDGSKDYDSMSKEELSKLKYSLTRKITRAKCMLQYQSENFQEQENPMPEGSQRVKYETKISKLEPELEAVNLALAKL